MRSLLAAGLVLTLAWPAAPAAADDIWRAAAAPTTPVQTRSAATEAPGNSSEIITLSRPIPLDPPPSEKAPGPTADNTGGQTPFRTAAQGSLITPIAFRAAADNVLVVNPVGSPLPSGPVSADKDKPGKFEDIPIKPTPLPAQPAPGQPGSSGVFYNGAGLGPNCDCGGCSCDGDVCCPACCDCFDPCCCCCYSRGNLFWFGAEYLLFETRHQNVPPLLTTGPPVPGVGGILGLPSTSVLFNSSNLPDSTRSGARFTLGFWVPGFDQLGVEATYFFLGMRNSNFLASSGGIPVLVRPFTDATTGKQSGLPVAFPGTVNGSFAVNSSSYLWGAELNLRQKLLCGPSFWIDGLAGFRHLQLQDSINMIDTENFATGTTTVVNDFFGTRNQFYGGQLGIEGEYNFWGRWFIRSALKVALGDVRETVLINGSTANGPVAPGATVPGGFLTGPGNMGRFVQNQFGVVPEFQFKLGYNFADHVRVFVGYNFLYLSSAVRAGDQINLNVNPAFAFGGGGPGPVQPQALFKHTDFWAQGMMFGVELRW
jgi:hypothetical protein